MPLTFSSVHELAMKLPDASVGTRWNTRTWIVNDRGFAWERPLRKSDLERLGDTPPPAGDILGVRTEDLDAKDALLAMDLPGFFTIAHFNGFPAVLIALKEARASDVRAAIVQAHRAVAAMPPARGAKRRAAKAKGKAPAKAKSKAKAKGAAKRTATSARASAKRSKTSKRT